MSDSDSDTEIEARRQFIREKMGHNKVKMDAFPELRDKAWRIDVNFADDAGAPFVLRNFIGRVEEKIYLHWRSGSYKWPFVLSNARHIQRSTCRALISALHIQELAQIASSRSTDYNIQFSLFDFRTTEVPMTSRCITIDPDDNFDAVLDDLSIELSNLIDVYRSIDFNQRCMPADRNNTMFTQPRSTTELEGDD